MASAKGGGSRGGGASNGGRGGSAKSQPLTGEDAVKALTAAGGREWQKDDMHRVYFSGSTIAEYGGLEWTRRRTGSIESATLDGSRISNSQMQSISYVFDQAKFYYDVPSGKFIVKDTRAGEAARYSKIYDKAFRELKRRINVTD